jgi:hypothetical protein
MIVMPMILHRKRPDNTSPSGQVCKPQSIPICFANIARAEGTLTGTQCKPHAEWRGRPPEATALPLSCAIVQPRHVSLLSLALLLDTKYQDSPHHHYDSQQQPPRRCSRRTP